MKAYWWKGAPNFGDAMAADLLAWLGAGAEWSDVSPKVLTIGSILHAARPGDTVWGSGLLAPTVVDLTGVTVLAVRGGATRKLLGLNCPVGDPALLSPRIYPDIRATPEREVGLVPHHSEYAAVRERFGDALVIDVGRPPKDVVGEIAACRRILSSSLHGLTVADAFAIPSAWVRFVVRPEESFNLLGYGLFKFRDYFDDCRFPRYVLDPIDVARVAARAECMRPPDLRPLLDLWHSHFARGPDERLLDRMSVGTRALSDP